MRHPGLESKSLSQPGSYQGHLHYCPPAEPQRRVSKSLSLLYWNQLLELPGYKTARERSTPLSSSQIAVAGAAELAYDRGRVRGLDARVVLVVDRPVFERAQMYGPFLDGDPAYRSRGDGNSPQPADLAESVADLVNWPAVRLAWGEHYPRLSDPPETPPPGSNFVKHTVRGSHFEFAAQTAELVRATIASPHMALGGLRVGMSDEEVLRRLPGYRGPERPATVTLHESAAGPRVTLRFRQRTLRAFEFERGTR